MTLTYGSLFSGTGMLDEGVQSVLGGQLSWYAEIDPAPFIDCRNEGKNR